MFHLFDSLRDARGPDFNWQDYHRTYALGMANGYPPCCVEWYSIQYAYGMRNLAQEYGVVPHGDDNQYVPCPKCDHKGMDFEEWCEFLCSGRRPVQPGQRVYRADWREEKE